MASTGSRPSGQVVKILNNMVMIETVAALAEALAIARRAGVGGEVLFCTLANERAGASAP